MPGHGPVCGPEVIDDVRGYLELVRGVAVRAHEAGLSPLDAAREIDLGPYAHLHDRERIVGNLHRALHELGGAAEGAPVDVLAAFADMLAYNGGGPLRCLA